MGNGGRWGVAAFLAVAVASGIAPATEPKPSAPAARAKTFPTQLIDSQQPRYTGEKISLSLKDADIKDVLRTFAKLTGLNIVVDPVVSGSVTVELRDVPWDQAFELILVINGLDYEMLNNVVYVAPKAKLARQPLYSLRR
jgi:type IV pilus assembly protein PilQ